MPISIRNIPSDFVQRRCIALRASPNLIRKSSMRLILLWVAIACILVLIDGEKIAPYPQRSPPPPSCDIAYRYLAFHIPGPIPDRFFFPRLFAFASGNLSILLSQCCISAVLIDNLPRSNSQYLYVGYQGRLLSA